MARSDDMSDADALVGECVEVRHQHEMARSDDPADGQQAEGVERGS